MPTIERRVCPDGTVRFRVRVRLHGARTASKTFHRNTDAQSYVGTVRRKGRQQTSQTYCYRATSRLYLRPSAIRLSPRMSGRSGMQTERHWIGHPIRAVRWLRGFDRHANIGIY
jgi:hypothetical protein